MDVRCDKCQARYRIDDARVGPSGLTMRCGKCGNTFKVTKDSAAGASAPPPAAPASKPAPAAPAKAAEPAPNATMVFGQAPVLPKPAPKPAPVPAPAGDGAGSTMMFGQSPVAPAIAAAALGKPKPAAAKPPDDSGSTMVFGSAPVLPKPAPTAMPKAASSAGKAAPAPAGDGAGSTMMFGQSPIAAKPPAPPAPKPPPPAPAPPQPAPVAEAPAEEHSPDATVEATDDEIPTSHSQSSVPAAAPKVEIPAEEQAAGHDEATKPGKKPQAEPAVAAPGESVGEDAVDTNAMTGDQASEPEAPAEEAAAEEEGALSKGPSKKLLMILGGVAAAVFLVLLILVAKKALGHKPPPEAATQALEQGRALLEKDSLATFGTALEATVSAIEAAPKTPFGEAHAVKAEIELAWSEALTEQSAILEDKAQRADDDKAKAEATTGSEKAKVDAKAHLKAALEATQAGYKADPKSPELTLALANYYRVTKSNSNFNKQLKKAAELKADEGKVALVEALKLLSDDDGAEKALPKLKTAMAAFPGSARVQYRIAKAYLALKNEAEALKALQETVKLSGSHERAQSLLNDLQANAPPAETPPAPEPEKK